jgi:hypothetical protein
LATAAVVTYGSNPVLGTAVGPVFCRKLTLTSTVANTVELEFGIRFGKPLTLRGPNEMFTLNLNGAAAAGASLDVMIEWTEEDQ